MKCAACHRPLSKPAVQHGHAAYGPRCAAKWGLMPGAKQATVRDEKTRDLFEEKRATA
jgi:uncharacterized paraquat-inducible protein A